MFELGAFKLSINAFKSITNEKTCDSWDTFVTEVHWCH